MMSDKTFDTPPEQDGEIVVIHPETGETHQGSWSVKYQEVEYPGYCLQGLDHLQHHKFTWREVKGGK